MNSIEQAQLDPLYAAMLRALQFQGKAEKTVEAYARANRRSADFFDRCPDDQTAEEIQTYCAALLKSHSWSTVKLDRCGLQFFYRYVLKRPWDWTGILKPPRSQSLPDVLTRELAWLKRHTRRLLWLNPLLRFAGYTPSARGAAVLHGACDGMLAVHNISRLQDLARGIAQVMKQ